MASLDDYLGTFFGNDAQAPQAAPSDPTTKITAGPVASQPAPAAPALATGTGIGAPSPAFPTDTAQNYLQAALNSGKGTPQDWATAANGQFNLPTGQQAVYYGPEVHGAPVIGLPGGYFAQAPNNGPWGWNARTEGAPGTGTGAPAPSAAAAGAGTFADPAFQQLLDLANKRIDALNQPQSFPQLDALTKLLTENQAVAKQRAADFAGQLQGRIGQLQQPLMTQQDVAAQRAGVMNNLQAQRDAALKNAKEQTFARGFEPTSGLLEGSTRSLNESFNNAQSNIDASLLRSNIATDEARRNQATQLQGLVQQALQGGDVTALGEQAQVADLENQLFNINQNRAREQLTTAQIPVDLSQTGLSNSLGLLSGGGNALSSLMGLLGLAGNQQQIGLGINQSNAAGWGQFLNLLLNAFGNA